MGNIRDPKWLQWLFSRGICLNQLDAIQYRFSKTKQQIYEISHNDNSLITTNLEWRFEQTRQC